MIECRNPRCDFFVDDRSGACPACGRRISRRSRRAEAAVSAASRPLDERYREAVDRSTELTRRWQELFEQRAVESGTRAGPTRAAGAPAAAVRDVMLEATAQTAAEWCEIRNRLGAEYIGNALDRLFELASSYRRRDDRWPHRCDRAIALAERLLGTLWLDDRVRTWAAAELDGFRDFVAGARIADELAGLSVGDLAPTASPPPWRMVGLGLPDDVDDDIVFHRARLRAELELERW